jgi:hypothetical protein
VKDEDESMLTTSELHASVPAAPSAGSVNGTARHPNRHFLNVPDDLIPTGTYYIDFFRYVNDHLRPCSYFEIGTHLGRSVRAFSCNAVCVDPEFRLDADVLAGRPQTHFYQMTSDAFFAECELRSIFANGPDICFLDGMHRSEYLLRDFTNTERQCHRRSIIFLHDCLPVNARMALRTHELGHESEGPWQHAWTGDVWKVVPLLRKHRPDLKIFLLDCIPTGLVAIANPDPTSTLLADLYATLVDELRDLDIETYSIRRLWSELPVISSLSLMQHPEDLTLFLNIL